MRVDGNVSLEGKAIAQGALTEGQAWITLGKGDRVDLQHTASARQWTVIGPARLRACPKGDEALWLAYGEVKAGSGSGMRPGAQVSVATPLGNVVWGDTKLTLKVSKDSATVDVETGTALLVPALGSQLKGKAEIQAKQQGSLKGSADTGKRALALVEACEKDAEESARLAQEVLAPAAAAPSTAPSASASVATRGNLGARARNHAEARGRARQICAAAWAGVGSSDSESLDLRSLEKRLEAADAKWRAVPMPARPTPAPTDKGE